MDTLLDKQEKIHRIISVLKAQTSQLGTPLMARLREQFGHDPFIVLISCLLSLRTRDTVTYPASVRLLERACTPQSLSQVPIDVISKIIYPVGFYRTKAATIVKICRILVQQYNCQVPNKREQLLQLPGVGPKTASLVLAEGFGIPAICVDTHVHRISNRVGIINTKTPEETERALMAIVPEQYWISWNQWLVLWGQSKCVGADPCSWCLLDALCESPPSGKKQSCEPAHANRSSKRKE
ncbi:MAG: endonuclease III [Candidatus Babeliales bacterium]